MIDAFTIALGSSKILNNLQASFSEFNINDKKRLAFKDFEIRRDFLKDKELNDIQSRIEHEDAELLEILKKLNENKDNPYNGDILFGSQKKIHQNLDIYLNYLEGIAMLIKEKALISANSPGFWTYYFRRIHNWAPLWEYASLPEYEWDVLVNHCKEAQRTYEQRKLSKP
ncbi:MAG: hypothetical protein HQL95_16200 [Magnetococcales bacterium]|nr:hypothetical protein [Magnetococcales bacterium]